MKKTGVFGVVLLLLIGLVAYTFWKDGKKTSISNDKDFAVKSSSITKIDLTNKKGEEMLLSKEGDVWMVNETYPARIQFVRELLHVMENIYAYAPIADVAMEPAIKQLVSNSVKVMVFTDGDKPHKVYYVGGVAPSNLGTNMLMEVDGKLASRVYEVRLPGHKGFVTPSFYIDEMLWRERAIFDFTPASIQQIEVKYFGEASDSSFVLKNSHNQYELEAFGTTYQHKELDLGVITNYLLGFGKKTVESFHNEYTAIDSVKTHMACAKLIITDVEGGVTAIPIYFMPVHQSSKQQYAKDGTRMPYDVDKYYAEVNDKKDWAIIQRYTFNQILIKPNNFLKK